MEIEPDSEVATRQSIMTNSSSAGATTDAEPVAGPSNGRISVAKENEETKNEANSSAATSVQGNWLSYTDLMSESYPVKSKLVYLKAFKLFEKFLKSKNQWEPNVCPSDLQVLNYFYYLRNDLKWAPTTLWSTYARINAVMKRLFGVSLNSYSRVGDVLKSYECGHKVKRAGIFTPQQIEDFVTDPELSSKYWLVRKVVCLIGYYGGFRNIELKSLKFENCEVDQMGYWFQFARSKQRGRLEETSICVPRRQPDWIPVVSDSSRVGLDFDPASLIDLYLAEVQADLLCSREELKGDFFRATHGLKGQKFTKLPLGKNTIGRVGVQVATELCLAKPEIYTGHCWRRSCGTSASDSGVNVTTLMAMMGWSNPKTAMVYVKKSRMTSLSMSLYLTNIQRRNCPNPFPKGPTEKRQAVKQTAVSASAVAKCSNTLVSSCSRLASSETSKLKLEDSNVELGTQDLIHELEAEDRGSQVSDVIDFEAIEEATLSEKAPESSSSSTVKKKEESVGGGGIENPQGASGVGGSVISSVANQLGISNPTLSGILHNLNNSGNVTIHFHFDGNQK